MMSTDVAVLRTTGSARDTRVRRNFRWIGDRTFMRHQCNRKGKPVPAAACTCMGRLARAIGRRGCHAVGTRSVARAGIARDGFSCLARVSWHQLQPSQHQQRSDPFLGAVSATQNSCRTPCPVVDCEVIVAGKPCKNLRPAISSRP